MLRAGKKPAGHAVRRRRPEHTREVLLQAAFQEVYHSGFRGSDLESILNTAGVTKGALYHHFENKEALGYAVVEEVITALTREKWLEPLRKAEDPIAVLIRIVESTSLKKEDIEGGCPLNNLAQEMSPLDEGFRKRLARVFHIWIGGIAAALEEGRRRGLVRQDVDPEGTASFFVATYEGYISLAKSFQDPKQLQAGKRSLIRYLEELRSE